MFPASEAAIGAKNTHVPIGINGFGRIGRNVFRASLTRSDVRVVAINHTCVTAEDIVYLINHDSTHRGFAAALVTPKIVVISQTCLRVGEVTVALFSSRDPGTLDWASAGVEYVAECTGKLTTTSLASAHLRAPSVKNVIISAPSKDAPTIVYGVNHAEFAHRMRVVSCASCTTNCVAPVAMILDSEFGIEQAFLTTVHASTQSQSILDGYKSHSRRAGRSVFGNIIPATTGAAKALVKVLPSLEGKISSTSLRVPVSNVSLIDLTVQLQKETALDEVLKRLRTAMGELPIGVLDVCEEELVSSDFIGNPCSAVVDAKACSALNSRFFKIVAWYDNEWAYSSRVLDLVSHIAAYNESIGENEAAG